MKSSEIREKFLKFFENYHHQRVKSSSLIPAADPTLLFTNAGMVQFKDSFLGLQDLGFRRATSCQKCVRAGGKHNDLENVGFTARHHTFFEMLGNFSFGDYFKKEAIAFAWELMTRHYSIPKERLWITVYEKDDEAAELWRAQGVRADWIIKLGEKDNFWAMGDTGPCGPCTEIHFDWGKKFGCRRSECNPGCPCGTRFLEIWNLVFMQFNRDAGGKMSKLPKPSVDTGAGLERLSSVLQGVYSNYDTDLFQPLIQAISKITHRPYGKDELSDVSFRVIADHIRAGTFLLADGVTPSNEGRGYVLRRILRRAIRHGKKLGQDKPFLDGLVSPVVELLGPVYSELGKNQGMVEEMLREEEEKFHETLHRGMGVLEEAIQKTVKEKKKALSGDVTFKLYDTFGFPLDLIAVICKENYLEVDEPGFNELMAKQRSQSVWNRGNNPLTESISKVVSKKGWVTSFLGYDSLQTTSEVLLVLSKEGKEVATLGPNEEGFVLFEKTPFYAESGGQVGDRGKIVGDSFVAGVQTTFKISNAILHHIIVEKGKAETKKAYLLEVDAKSRQATAINHTATHLLHAALRTLLGPRVKQGGSLVEPARLRFDFTFPRALTQDDIQKIELLVNDEIFVDDEVSVNEMPFDEAMKSGALAFFDEKYGDRVRVIRVGNRTQSFSVELCGGTHLKRTSQVGAFKIVSESSIASGVRRIEAITSTTAIDHLSSRDLLLKDVERYLGTSGSPLVQKIEHLLAENKNLKQKNEKLQLASVQTRVGDTGPSLWEKKIRIKDLLVVAETVPSMNPKLLRSLVDQVRDKLMEKTIVILATESEGKASLCVGLTKDLVGRFDASKLIQPAAQKVGGTGGGRADFAQAGGTNPALLAEALKDFMAALGRD